VPVIPDEQTVDERRAIQPIPQHIKGQAG